MFLPGPHGGGAVYADQEHKDRNDRWGFAGAYRAGDHVFLSGIIAFVLETETVGIEGYKSALRTAFARADSIFRAAGSSLEDVVDILSFHVWDSAHLEDGLRGDRYAQFGAIAEVKREFMRQPDPAWTAVGSSGLIIGDHGLVEIRMVAYSPARK